MAVRDAVRPVARAALVAVLAVVVTVSVASASAHHGRATKGGPATFLGPNGVEARWVIAENEKRGDRNWRITAGGHGTIAGFANATYAAEGQTVRLYVTSSAPRFSIQAFRMGFYGGAGARLVFTRRGVVAPSQPPCKKTSGINLVSCANWHSTYQLKVSSSFVQGDYLIKLTSASGAQSYVPLTVWDPTSHAAYVVKNDVFTWQAWNPYGGFDFYQGVGACAPTYPVCNRARVVSYDRPYGYGDGAGDFLSEEYPLVEFAERRGLDLTYVTDVTIEQHPSLVRNHRVLLSLGHDECWALGERVAVQDAAAKGLNVVFFGASGMLRHVRLEPSVLGPDRQLVDYRNSTEDPLNGKGNPLLVTGNTWASPPASWSETPFVGAVYVGYLLPDAKPVPFVVADASAWVFQGTGLHNGSSLPGVIASDYDEYQPGLRTAGPVEIFGHSPVPGTHFYSDMTYYTAARGHGGVLDTGTNYWIPALASCRRGPSCAVTKVDRITKNILAVFGRGPAGDFKPSVTIRHALSGGTP